MRVYFYSESTIIAVQDDDYYYYCFDEPLQHVQQNLEGTLV